MTVRIHTALTAFVALTALGMASGVVVPQTAHAQSLAKPNNDAHDRANLGEKIRPNAPVVIAPGKDGAYETTKRTKGGYAVNLQSKAKFGTIVDGNYLFVVNPDGNYLFTKTASGLMLLPGGWNVTTGGDVVDPNGKSTRIDGSPFTTPQGVIIGRSKDGETTLTFPDKSVFSIHDTLGKGMNPSGMYYD